MTIVGIDFSGGVKAGQKIWIAVGRVEDKTLLIEECFGVTRCPPQDVIEHVA
jgi:hypothetical protein